MVKLSLQSMKKQRRGIIFFSLVMCFLGSLAVTYSLSAAYQMHKTDLTMQNASMQLQIQLIEAHLALEEALRIGQYNDLQSHQANVKALFTAARQSISTMLIAGQIKQWGLLPFLDLLQQQMTQSLAAKITTLQQITDLKFRDPNAFIPGSALDYEYETLSDQVLHDTTLLEMYIRNKIQHAFYVFEQLQFFLILLIVTISIVGGRILLRYEKHHEQHTIELAENNKKLLAAKESAELANRLKTEFLANISHELRTPLHAILSFSQLGSSKLHAVTLEKLANYFSNIHDSGQRLLGLVNDLLDLSKLEARQMDFVMVENDLLLIVQDCFKEQSARLKERRLKFTLKADKNKTIAVFDPNRIHQVISNLLANAIKFSDPGKTLHISLTEDTVSGGKRKTDPKNLPAIRFSLRDEGNGFPENELEMVFDKFTQSSTTKNQPGGTGLGLAICKEIIEGHRGKIWAENHTRRGAILHFAIPVKQQYY